MGRVALPVDTAVGEAGSVVEDDTAAGAALAALVPDGIEKWGEDVRLDGLEWAGSLAALWAVHLLVASAARVE